MTSSRKLFLIALFWMILFCNVVSYAQSDERHSDRDMNSFEEDINGDSESQDDYADDLKTTGDGTDMSNIPDVLNIKHGRKYYELYEGIKNFNDWKGKVRYSIVQEMPAVLDINTKDYVQEFGYYTTGHFLNVGGYRVWDNKIYVAVVDPNREERRNWYDADILYQVNVDHWRKAIVW